MDEQLSNNEKFIQAYLKLCKELKLIGEESENEFDLGITYEDKEILNLEEVQELEEWYDEAVEDIAELLIPLGQCYEEEESSEDKDLPTVDCLVGLAETIGCDVDEELYKKTSENQSILCKMIRQEFQNNFEELYEEVYNDEEEEALVMLNITEYGVLWREFK